MKVISYLVHGGVLMKTVNVTSDGVDHPHAVQVGECSLSTTQPTCQQLNNSLDICRVTKLDHVEATIWQVDFQCGLVLVDGRAGHDSRPGGMTPVTLRYSWSPG